MKPLAQNTLIQNRYLVVHLIGKGGMGEVYLAVDQRLGSAVALKRTYFAGDEMLGSAFEREARTLARMRHPVLPKVSDHFGEGEEQYLVMEHISGDDLAKRLEAAQKPFPVSWVMFWADQLLDALSYLHSNEPPIIHRDIKPQNLKLTDENHIILLDFGLSKTSTGQTHISNTGSTGSVVGYTPHYAPMEQIRGIGTSARSDLYSLSATLYQLMTNVVPADALSRADALLNGLADPIEQPHRLNPEVPATVSETILKGMEVSQEKRFGNARDMQKALRRAFTKMQEAMAAQTVAFNLGDVDQLAAAVEKTKLMPSEPMNMPVAEAVPTPVPADDRAVDFDATLAFDPVENIEQARQAGIRPELYSPMTEGNGEVPLPSAPIPEPQADNDEEPHTSFVTVIAGAHPETNSMPGAVANDTAQPAPAAAAVMTKPAKSPGRLVAVLGGLAAFLVLGVGAAAAGWYFYTNYNSAAAVVEPSPLPSPEPTVAEPAAPVTAEVPAVNSNSPTNTNTETTESLVDTNTNTQPTTDAPAPVRSETDSTPSRQNPAAARATNRTTAPPPTTKAKPKPKTGRTDILQ